MIKYLITRVDGLMKCRCADVSDVIWGARPPASIPAECASPVSRCHDQQSSPEVGDIASFPISGAPNLVSQY